MTQVSRVVDTALTAVIRSGYLHNPEGTLATVEADHRNMVPAQGFEPWTY